jgi:hypothetical protein
MSVLFVRNEVDAVSFRQWGDNFLVELRPWQTRPALVHRADSNAPSSPDRSAFLPTPNPNRVVVKLREHLAHPTDIILQYSYEELFSNVVKNGRQGSGYLFSFPRGPNWRKPAVARKGVAHDQTLCFQAADKTSDLAFISPDGYRELAGRDSSCLYATKKHSRFLERHPKPQEAAVERCLQLDAGPKKPEHEKIFAPFLSAEGLRPNCTGDRCKNTPDLLAALCLSLLAH